MKARTVLAVLLVALVLVSPAGATVEPASFVLGVASGEVSKNSAILWTRTEHGQVRVDLSTSPSFAPLVLSRTVNVPPNRDGTVRTKVAGLAPGTTYHYRFFDPESGQFSRTGTFSTAPGPTQDVDVRFAFSGDSDGTLNPFTGLPAFNSFQTLDRVRVEGVDFFMYLGDTIYSDSLFRPLGPADDLEDYRAAYRQNRTFDALRDLEAALPIYAQWDDHEVRNDFDPATVDPALLASGLRAFQEYMPVKGYDDQLGFYRTFRWGRNLQLFVLDERSFRSPSASAGGVCDNPPGSGVPDVAPTLPQPIRSAFAAIAPALSSLVPPGCLAAINDPARTFLGAAQKARFQDDLLSSQATFKVVFSEDPMQELFALPYDSWAGYAAERGEILGFIDSNQIGGVVWLTTDVHANIVNDVFTASFGGSDTGMDEVIVGPIATFTFAQEINGFTGVPFAATVFRNNFLLAPRAFGGLGARCAELDVFAYGSVTYDASASILTIEVKDDVGAAVCPPLVVRG